MILKKSFFNYDITMYKDQCYDMVDFKMSISNTMEKITSNFYQIYYLFQKTNMIKKKIIMQKRG